MEFSLSGTCYAELNTEIRFRVAEARSDKSELLCLLMPSGNEDSARITNCVTRVLRAMMREDLIQFFVPENELGTGSTESEFLANKYEKALRDTSAGSSAFYVKI